METSRTATAAGGTRPTGMHSCCPNVYYCVGNTSVSDAVSDLLPFQEIDKKSQ